MILRGASAYLLRGCTDEEILLCGPAGTSKTVAACQWLIDACQRYPGSQHLLCRDKRSSMTDTTLVTMESVLGDKSFECQRVAREQRHSYRVYDSEIVVGGLDEPTKLFGSAFGRIVIDEAIETTLGVWELFGRAARDPKYRRDDEVASGIVCPHQRLAVTNPGDPFHWLNVRATPEPSIERDPEHLTYDNWRRLYAYSAGPQTGKMRRLISVHQDNPRWGAWQDKRFVWTDAGRRYLESLAKMSGFRRQRMLSGRWVSGVGDPVFDHEALDRMDARVALIEREFPTLVHSASLFAKWAEAA